jgi:hypothetical protein
LMMDSVKVGFGGGVTNGQLMVERGKLLEIFWQSNHSSPKSPLREMREVRAPTGEGGAG